MQVIHLACGNELTIPGAENVTLPEVPGRNDLRFLDAIAAESISEDSTPSLAEIQASPNVNHLGDPQFPLQVPSTPKRVVVSGLDSSLGAVLTRMMRGDYMWAEVAYVPSDPTSPGATCWGIPTGSSADMIEFACEAPVVPSACVRTDTGEAVAGSAEIFHADGTDEYVGEIVVDSETLVFRDGEEQSARFFGQFGARLVPTMSAPGIACTPLVTPLAGPDISTDSPRSPQQLEWLASTPGLGWLTRGKHVPPGLTDSSRVLTGRAVQTGGKDITVVVDGIRKPRTATRATFYRHLRDIQSVRQA